MALTMHQRPRVMWIPLLMAGSVLYWTIALGLGGLSVSFLGDFDDGPMELDPDSTAPVPTPREEPIIVHLQTWNEARAMAPALSEDPPAVPGVDDGSSHPGGGSDHPLTIPSQYSQVRHLLAD
jgi:hypothetical protein